MKKIGKMGYIAIGSLFTLIVGFSLLTFAEQSNTQTSSSSHTVSNENEFEGNPTLIDNTNNKITLFNGSKKQDFILNSDTIIYRNGQKTTLDQLQYTDDVKVTLNSEQVVRYVVATQVQPVNSTNNATATATQNNAQTQSTSVKTNASSSVQNQPLNIRELKLHIDYGHGINYDMDYHKDDKGKVDSHIHKKTEGQNIEAKEQQATTYIESFVQQLRLTPNSNQSEILNKVQSILGVKDGTYKNLEFKVKFSDNQEFHIHLDSKGHDK
jgi:hypothetical protein